MLLVSEGEKENIDLYGGAGIPAFEEVWLMYNADAYSTLGLA